MNKNQKIHNWQSLKPLRRELRATMTAAEISLWMQLKSSKLAGRKFRRQHSIGQYIVDFYCPAESLVIELDGAPHNTEQGFLRDQARDDSIAGLGFKTLRFENKDVIQNMDGVLQIIQQSFGAISSLAFTTSAVTTPAARGDPSSGEEGK